MEQTKYDVFISYSRKDTAIADKICDALDRQGISYFIDRQGIGGGQEFPDVLAKAIIGCRIMLYLASANSYCSKFTNNEITFAFNEKPKGSVLPYVIDGSRLPDTQRFIFASVNIRTLEEHPIDTILMQDLCLLLGREYRKTEKILGGTWRNAESTPSPSNKSTPRDGLLPVQSFEVNGVTFKMIRVEGQGTPFYIGETQVTQALWEVVMGNNPSKYQYMGRNKPVVQVNWDDCQKFIKRLNFHTGRTFRLPKEKEWEYAAKGGNKSKGFVYAGSNTINEVGWYNENSYQKNYYGGYTYSTHDVMLKKPNELGIYDMCGNVQEWCEDAYGMSNGLRAVRGGSWKHKASQCRSDFKDALVSSFRDYYVGFRLAL